MAEKRTEEIKRPFKKAIAKKGSKSPDSKEVLKKTKEAISSLNSKLLEFISDASENNKNIDLRTTGLMYLDAIGIIKGTKNTSILPEPCQLNTIRRNVNDNIKKRSSYYMKKHGDLYFTDSYLGLCSIYGINPITKNNNQGLFSLLDQDFDASFEKKPIFNYIKVCEIVKSKGNAINGPRKEDVGNFNRKLFETYSKEIEQASVTRSSVNLKFFNFSKWSGIDDQILFSDFVKFYIFNGPEKRFIDEFILIIHKNRENVLISALNTENELFSSKFNDSFHASLSKNKNKISIFNIEEFSLYELCFINENAALDAYEKFFKNSELVSSQIDAFDMHALPDYT